MDVICDEDGQEYKEIVDLEKEQFIEIMLRLHQANASRKWRLVVENAKMEKSDLSLNTYVEDFKFWVMAAGNACRLPRKRLLKFLSVASSLIFFVRRFIRDRSRH